MPENSFIPDLPVAFTHAILNSINDPFNIVDRQFRVLWANQARARFHKQNLKDMIGERCYRMFQRRSKPCTECPVRIVFETGKPHIMEKSVVLPDGSTKWGDIRCYPVFDRKGDVKYVIQIMIDITKRMSRTSRQRRYLDMLEATVREIGNKRVEKLVDQDGKDASVGLSDREREVLGLLVEGYSNAEIGRVLDISAQTVKTHVKHVFEKLGVHDRTRAAVFAVRRRLS